MVVWELYGVVRALRNIVRYTEFLFNLELLGLIGVIESYREV